MSSSEVAQLSAAELNSAIRILDQVIGRPSHIFDQSFPATDEVRNTVKVAEVPDKMSVESSGGRLIDLGVDKTIAKISLNKDRHRLRIKGKDQLEWCHTRKR